MRVFPTRARAAAWVFGLAAVMSAPGRSKAQEIMYINPQNGYVRTRPHLAHSFFWRRDVFPRTYSYDYVPWLNRPRMHRVHGPNGSYWTSSILAHPVAAPVSQPGPGY
jgi:hypothetical protein